MLAVLGIPAELNQRPVFDEERTLLDKCKVVYIVAQCDSKLGYESVNSSLLETSYTMLPRISHGERGFTIARLPCCHDEYTTCCMHTMGCKVCKYVTIQFPCFV